MFANIANSLGVGSGINTVQLVTDLLAASQGAKLGQLNQRSQLNSSRISAMAATQSALTTFAAAVKETLNGQGFIGDLVSGRQDLATASVLKGGGQKACLLRLRSCKLQSPNARYRISLPVLPLPLASERLPSTIVAEVLMLSSTAPTIALLACAMR
ncbi:flagellar cap protein FliD N-terminal domain-containing protein [Parasphingorhabdus halotolerans]|uniref:flagellar cap protein FliD N-terminal domain-containing protein n=1 Tax=Parasphingorhabdus halotolerans TaxID=2725558 RepID=UPI001FE60876|nr:flagellar cap protein FliD N-terminal domain-containing protein [Parasphingorhabdus halotolerans]